jgi:hypothetical protein
MKDTSKNKSAAVEWLVNQFEKNFCFTWEDIVKAKEIEKQHNEDAFNESRLTHPMIGFKHETFEQYYNETFNK